jgi:hypothetical protein
MEVSQPSLGSPRSVKTERHSRFSFHSRQPALVHVDVVSDGLDVIAIAESAIGLPFGQNGGEMVIPAELCRATVSKAVLEKPGRRGRLSCMRCV